MSRWTKLFSGESTSSAGSAKQRLQFVLVHDRNEIPPGMLELIKDDVIAVISRRIHIDRANVEVHVTHEASEGKLVVDIPLLLSEEPVSGRTTGRTTGRTQTPRA
ncbi:MAG: cell division topological specificity factor MinE [Chloroflexi bacterium]|nr:cell division topological specificity factor MinE [Chloroflexota bacterium]